jgi:hypothetical protein
MRALLDFIHARGGLPPDSSKAAAENARLLEFTNGHARAQMCREVNLWKQ